jgi:hypothetical protein
MLCANVVAARQHRPTTEPQVWGLRDVLARLRLLAAAVRLVEHGWPVTPGAQLRAGRFDCGRPGCHTRACHPVLDGWERIAWPDPAATDWWRDAAYSVLLPTGTAFDVIDVPTPLGAAALTRLRWWGTGPVAATPTGRWMFLVRPGQPLVPALQRRLDLVRHGRGSWIPAPPTQLAEGPVRWVVAPTQVGWRLPDPGVLQRRLLESLSDSR